MKKQMIELNKLDELLLDYKQMKNRGESFSDFIRVSKCLDFPKKNINTFDWVLVDEKHIREVTENEK